MINYDDVPESTKYTLDAWAERAQPPGGFCGAVLENDLNRAYAYADDENVSAMHSIVAYVYNRLPQGCWGSPERVRAWASAKRKERAA